MARYMSSAMYGGKYTIDPEKLVIGAGCNAVLENLLFTIAEPGACSLPVKRSAPGGGYRCISGGRGALQPCIYM
jgi:hypothetical protein